MAMTTGCAGPPRKKKSLTIYLIFPISTGGNHTGDCIKNAFTY